MTIFCFKRFKFVVLRIIYLFILIFVIFSSNNSFGFNINNNHNVKSLSTSSFYGKKNNVIIKNINELNKYDNRYIINFNGNLLINDLIKEEGYSCLDNYNNDFYEDKDFGLINVIIADNSIDCGSIIKINTNEEIYGIVLDRDNKYVNFNIGIYRNSFNNNIESINNGNFSIIRKGF